MVTPSRVCELKYKCKWPVTFSRQSHPHGCVSWNIRQRDSDEIFWSHPHGCVSWNIKNPGYIDIQPVTPSRVCELKLPLCRFQILKVERHTLTGVWVEIFFAFFIIRFLLSHTLTGVWVEILQNRPNVWFCSHTLTGVWVEISKIGYKMIFDRSHPHGCVSWNQADLF